MDDSISIRSAVTGGGLWSDEVLAYKGFND